MDEDLIEDLKLEVENALGVFLYKEYKLFEYSVVSHDFSESDIKNKKYMVTVKIKISLPNNGNFFYTTLKFKIKYHAYDDDNTDFDTRIVLKTPEGIDVEHCKWSGEALGAFLLRELLEQNSKENIIDVKNMKPLDYKMARVLHDNLHELYDEDK
jgi:hypothetical protein